MSGLRDQARQRQAQAETAERELAGLYAKVAAGPAGSRVLADITGRLADPDFACAGLRERGEGFLARIREAGRIDLMIRRGRAGV